MYFLADWHTQEAYGSGGLDTFSACELRKPEESKLGTSSTQASSLAAPPELNRSRIKTIFLAVQSFQLSPSAYFSYSKRKNS